MSPRAAKTKKSQWHKQSVDQKLSIGFLVTFAILTGIYLTAVFKYETATPAVVYESSNQETAGFFVPRGKIENKQLLKSFSSPDDFKSYLDDGKREFGDGIYETQALDLADAAPAAPENVKTAVAKNTSKNQKTGDEIIGSADGEKYMSLGRKENGKPGDIILLDAAHIYFSPESQFYGPKAGETAGLDNQADGETKIFDISDAASLALAGTVPHEGTLAIGEGRLMAFSGNSISVYDIASVFAPEEIWKARINDGSEIISYEISGSKLYLGLRTAIDPANPCPLKPITIGQKPLIIDCDAIFHPALPIVADSIFSVIEIDGASGQTARNLSFVGARDNASVLLADGSITAAWGQGGDYISFFNGFLQTKCKSLLPNYLLEKAAKLPGCAISLAAKELELRSLLSNWFLSLSKDEQTRVSGEVASRLNDYLRDNYRDFEQTGVARADFDSMTFNYQNEVAGRLAGNGSIDVKDGKLRMATISGNGAIKKMAWLITGKIAAQDQQKTLSNVYVLDGKFEIISANENLDLAAGVCALRYAKDFVIASTCRQSDPMYSISLLSGSAGIMGQVKPAGFPSYFYPFDDGMLLAISKNNRKIKLTLYDATLPAKIEKVSEYDLNDYWADIDGNFRAFAIDDAAKTFFLPSARGGYIFNRGNGSIKLEKTAGDIVSSRAVFYGDYLYLAGDDGIEVLGGADWAKIKSIKF